MKKYLFILALAAAGMTANAQKAKLSTVKNMIILNQLDNAKSAMAEVLVHEKTKDLPDTYLQAALLEAKLYVGKKGDANSLQTVKDYMAKAEELNQMVNEKGKRINKADKDIAKTYGELVQLVPQIGAVAFDLQDFGMGRDAFLYTIDVDKKLNGDLYNEKMDSLYFINAGYAASQAKDYVTAAQCFEKCFEIEYEGIKAIRHAHWCYEQMGDSAKMESALKRGFEKYTGDKDLLILLINYYITSNRNAEALAYLNTAIAGDPNNADFYFARACLNEKIDQSVAIQDYEQALKVNPNHFNSLYNSAILLYNQGAEMNRNASSERDDKKYQAMLNEAKKLFAASAPYIDRAVESATSKEMKLEAMKIAKQIYYQVDQNKWSVYNNMIKEMEQ